MSETPLLDDQNTQTSEQTADDLYADNTAIQDGLRESADSAQRLFADAPEADVPDDTEAAKTRLRLTPRGKVVGAAVIATTVAGAVVGIPAAAEAIKDAQIEALLSKPTVDVTVQNGDGLQKIIEEHVPQVASGKYDWRDVASDIGHLPQNSEISEPGYVLMPGDTVTIPIYNSTENK